MAKNFWHHPSAYSEVSSATRDMDCDVWKPQNKKKEVLLGLHAKSYDDYILQTNFRRTEAKSFVLYRGIGFQIKVSKPPVLKVLHNETLPVPLRVLGLGFRVSCREHSRSSTRGANLGQVSQGPKRLPISC